jgi:hypothetical protein
MTFAPCSAPPVDQLHVVSAERLDQQFETAIPTFKDVASGGALDGAHRRLLAVDDPATGTCVISPELDRKIQKALKRAARGIAFRLLLRLPLLEFECYLLKLRYVTLDFRRYPVRSAFKRFFDGH